jgi:endo-1,4-beta-mannosidase
MTKIVNIDALREESPFVLVIGDAEHKMQVATVQDFIENMKLIEGLGTNPSMTDEIEISIKVIARAFPTIPEKDIRQWQVSTIQKLFDIARGADVTQTVEDEAGNAPKAS